MMKKYLRASLAAAIILLTGCANLTQDQSQSGIWDSRKSQWVDQPTLVKDLLDSKYVVVGELHQNDYLRDRLLELLKELKEQEWLEAVAMDTLQSKHLGDEMTWLEQLEKRNPQLVTRYKTLIEWLDEEDIPLIAAAVPLDKLKSMINQDAQQWLREQTRTTLTDKQLEDLKNILWSSHPGKNEDEASEKLDYLLAAQQLQDYFMARMLRAIKANSVLITRAFHARNDLGIVPYIKADGSNPKTTSILMLSTMDSQEDMTEALKSFAGQYDYVWLRSSDKGLLLAPTEDEKAPAKTSD